MPKLNFLFSLTLLFTLQSPTLAVERQSYKPLDVKAPQLFSILMNDPKGVLNLQEPLSKPKEDGLIHDNLNRDWVKPESPKSLKTIAPFSPFNYAGGTGTRGGGSGLMTKGPDGFNEVKLLEIFRSENLAQYNLFFPIDEQLRRLEDHATSEASAKLIFETVLGRIGQVAPGLARKISVLYQEDLPFKNWIPVVQDLPSIADELQYPLEPNKDKVQIAVRRTKYIVYNVRAYAAMSPLNRAALWMHEYIYALSSLENSIKTQRTVSLFFSSDFLTIAADELKLTHLFFELDLLAISRRSIEGSLPPGARLAKQKQTENCGLLAEIKGTAPGKKVDIGIQLRGSLQTLSLAPSEAVIVLSSLKWSKAFLEKAFPIYKYSGQKIMADRVCLNADRTKITQVQSALAIDDEMFKATEKVAWTQAQLFKAKSDLAEAHLRLQDDPRNSNFASVISILDRVRELNLELFKNELDFSQISITSFEKIVNPKMLGEYHIATEY